MISLGKGDFIVLHNVTVANLTAGDFILGAAAEAAPKDSEVPVMEQAVQSWGGNDAMLYAGDSLITPHDKVFV